MNDDPPPSSAAPNVGRPADAQAATDETMQQRNDSVSRSPSQSRRRRKKKGKKKRNPGLKKKLGFVTHMLQSLDLLVFAELSAMYYMEYVVLSSQNRHKHEVLTVFSFYLDVPCFGSCYDALGNTSTSAPRTRLFLS